MSDVPVLMVVYKRADTTRRVLAALAKVQPKRLFVSANAPDPANPADIAKCQAVRVLFDNLSWPCEVTRNFRTEHLRAKHSIVSAIDWYFEHVEAGIILEDDCEPDPTFFPFCEELLERYRDEPRIMQIGANNVQSPESNPSSSYYFSLYGHIWGWATWRRAWRLNDPDCALLVPARAKEILAERFPRARDRAYWRQVIDGCRRDCFETWDYQWVFSMWNHGGLAISPRTNLVRNLGFGSGSTNTVDAESRWGKLELEPMSFPLYHPVSLEADKRADAYTSDDFIGISPMRYIKVFVSARMPRSWKRILKSMWVHNVRPKVQLVHGRQLRRSKSAT